MRKAILALGLLLGACTTTSTGTSSNAAQVACEIDGDVQPIAAALVATLVPAATPAVALDNGLIHPAIQAYCASQGGKAVKTHGAQAGTALTISPTGQITVSGVTISASSGPITLTIPGVSH